jgi:hypothetical protein
MKYFFLVLLIACTSLGPRYSPQSSEDKTKALVYIYRVKKFAGSVGSPYVCLDHKVIGEVKNGAYFMIEMGPGKHDLELRSLDHYVLGNFPFILKSGETYFVRFDASMNNGIKSNVNGTIPPKSAAMGAVAGGMQAAANGYFFADGSEKKKILDALDKRAQESSQNPGFMLVNPDFAEKEIAETQAFHIPGYSSNPCQ